jgi:Ca-dependent carbohydrate-binding module xylan-binding
MPLEEGPAIVVAGALQPTPMTMLSQRLALEGLGSSRQEPGWADPPQPAASTETDVRDPTIVSIPAATMETSNTEYTHPHDDGEIQLSVDATLSAQVDLEQPPTKVSVIARGIWAGGDWPRLEVQLGDTPLGTVTVDSDTEQEYVLPIDTFDFPPIDAATSAVSLPLKVSFINDWFQPETGEDRNVLIRRVSVTEGGR